MKKNFLTLPFLMFAWSLISQAPQLTVNVKDECNALFAKQINISLFKITGFDTTLVASVTKNPAEFKNLDKSTHYVVKVSSNDVPAKDLKVLDLVYLRNQILGITNLNRIAKLAGDINGNRTLTTLDQVLLIRDILYIESYVPSKWYFAKANENSSQNGVPQSDVFGIGTLSSDVVLDVIAVQKGHVANATGNYCPDKCTKSKNGLVNIHFENIIVEKGKQVEIPIYVKKDDKVAGLKARFTSLKGKFSFNNNYFYSKISTDSSLIDLYWQENNNPNQAGSNGYVHIFSLKFTPSENGHLKNLLNISTESAEGVVYEGACLVSLNSIKLNDFAASASCITSWPKDITIPECTSTYPTGKPEISFECSRSFGIAYTDSVVGNCQKIIRKWIALNYATLQKFEHTQIITINPTFNNYCKRNVTINVSAGAKIITPTTLISNKNPNHLYSFSPVNPGDTTRVLTYDQSQFEEFHIYNITTSEFCIATIVKTLCDSTTVNIRLRDILTVKNSNGYTVNARDFDIGSQHGCGTVKEFEISFDNGPFKPSLTFIEAYRGQTVLLRIRYKVNTAYFNFGTVKVWFLNENEPAPLELFVYDDFLKKGKEYTLAVQSQNFKAVFAFQLGLKIQEAVLNKCESGDIKITYNEPIKGNVRLIFVDEKSVGNTVSPDVPIFLIKLTPNRDGFASEFLSLSEEVMYSEAVYFNQVSKVKMKMFFPQRVLTDSEDFGLEQQLKVYPNPVNSDDFHIVLPESFSNEVQISMFDIQGKLCSASTKIIENKTLSLTLPMELKNGLYFLKIFDGKKHKSAKIILQR